jgi:holo-[acyl-carrier protein] synthase
MIVGVGLDVCEIDRIARALAGASGARFRARVFTAGEVAYGRARGRAGVQSYAAAFAAKEAVLKALGTGWGKGLGWHAVEVVHAAAGAPAIVLRGPARTLARRRGVGRVHLTLSHGGGLAVAMVVLESGGAGAATRRQPRSRPRSR